MARLFRLLLFAVVSVIAVITIVVPVIAIVSVDPVISIIGFFFGTGSAFPGTSLIVFRLSSESQGERDYGQGEECYNFFHGFLITGF